MLDFIWGLPIVLGLLALAVGLPVFGWYMAIARRCPRCGRHALAWIDQSVFYDPYPGRSLHRCRQCQAEFARWRWRWVPREQWDREWGEDIWDKFDRA